MAVFTRFTVLLAALLHISCVICIPVPFGEVEKAWKQGRSERDIHASALATPSFFHEARTADALPQPHIRASTQAFDSALDERSLAAASVASKREASSANTVARGLDVVVAVQGLMDRKLVQWMREGGGLREREGGDAPVLRPRGGKRWNF